MTDDGPTAAAKRLLAWEPGGMYEIGHTFEDDVRHVAQAYLSLRVAAARWNDAVVKLQIDGDAMKAELRRLKKLEGDE